MNFIDYKRTAHWLPRISKGIADRLIHDPIERTNEPTKLLKCLQEYERCLSAANICSKTTGQCLSSLNAEKRNPGLIDSPSTVESCNGMHDFKDK